MIKWISANKKQPEEPGKYLVTVLPQNGIRAVYFAEYDAELKTQDCSGYMTAAGRIMPDGPKTPGWVARCPVIAWAKVTPGVPGEDDWRSPEDPPENDREVLVTTATKKGKINVGCSHYSRYANYSRWVSAAQVTAWMEINPYEGE